MRTSDILTIVVASTAGILLPMMGFIIRLVSKMHTNEAVLTRVVSDVKDMTEVIRRDSRRTDSRLVWLENHLYKKGARKEEYGDE